MVRKKETEVKDFKKQSNFSNVSPKTRDIVSSKATSETDESNQGVLKTADKALSVYDKKRVKANQDKKKIISGQDKEKLTASENKKKIVAGQDKKKLKASENKKKIVAGQDKKKLKASENKKKIVAGQDKKKLKASEDKKKIVAGQDKKKLKASENKKKIVASENKKKLVSNHNKKKLLSSQDKKKANSAPLNKKIRSQNESSTKLANSNGSKLKKQEVKKVRTDQKEIKKKQEVTLQKQSARKKQYQEARKKINKSKKLSGGAGTSSTVTERLVEFIKSFKPQNLMKGKAGFAIGSVSGLLLPVLLTFAVLMTIFAGFAMGSSFKDDSGSGEAPVSGVQLQVATQTYQHLMKEHKFTSAGASGALAVAQRESGFDPKAINPAGGVAGLFQWSGWGSLINGNRIHSEGSIKGMDLTTLTLENQFKLIDYELNGSYSKVKTLLSKSDDPVQSAKDWSLYYEGVSLEDGQTNLEMISKLANEWYAYFNSSGTGGGRDPSSILSPVLNQRIYGGQCYGMTAYYVEKVGGPQLMGSGHMSAEDIGTDYDWKSYGWSVIMYPKYEQIKAGDVINWTAGGALAPGIWGHTGVVKKVTGNGNIETFEQNGGYGEIVLEYTRSYSASQVKSIVRPPSK